jgi:hypothetical protein
VSWDTAIVSKKGPTIAVGFATAQGLKAKPADRVRATQSNLSERLSDTKGGQQLEHLEPHRGDPASSTFISESQPEGFILAPSCGVASRRPDFLLGLPGKDV